MRTAVPTYGILLLLLDAAPLAAQPNDPAQPPLRRDSSRVERSLDLAELEQMALGQNPTLRRAGAMVQAARGRALQAGLYPNPTLQYTSEEIGASGSGGLHGALVQQTFVTAGKLQLSRQARFQQVAREQAAAYAQYLRVLNGVRVRFFALLGLEQSVKLRTTLAKNAKDLQRTAERLKNTGKINRPAELLVIIQARQAAVDLQAAQNRYRAAWRDLAAFVGDPWLPSQRLEGKLEVRNEPLDHEETLGELLATSPELVAAQAEVAHRRVALQRQFAEPVPNVDVGLGTQYSFETDEQVALANLSIKLPLFDRNQGNIHAAQAELARAGAELQNLELSLRRRHARTFARYLTARQRAESYRIQLNDATEMYGLYQEAFALRRVSYEQVLVAQRSFVQLNVDYLNALVELRQAEVALSGLLLVDGPDRF